jgi:predicted bacteriocin transport accessory protein
MKKKILFVVLIILAAVAFIFIHKINSDYKKTDAYKFKTEYESLNGVENDYGKKYRKLDINKKNRIIYSTAKEIVEKTENKETFIVYFGFAKCPWCRSMVENLVDLSIENDTDIYYVDVLEIRDTIELVDGELKTTKEGDENYMKLIELYSDVLSNYTIKNGEEKITTGEKRIYAPNVVAVVNGEAKEMVEGVSEELEDPYGEITEAMKKASIKQLKCIFKCIDEAGICTGPSSC